jgi:hypothetical protein
MLVGVDGYARTFTFVVMLADGAEGISRLHTRVNMYEMHLSGILARMLRFLGRRSTRTALDLRLQERIEMKLILWVFDMIKVTQNGRE